MVYDPNYHRAWRKANPDKERAAMQRYIAKHPDWYDNLRQWARDNPAKVREAKQRWNRDNIEKCREHRRRSYHKCKILKGRPKADPLKRKQWQLAYEKARRQRDPQYRLRCNIGGRIRGALKLAEKSKARQHTEEMVGYTMAELRAHLESQFEWWMSWENYGLLWHIDHIKQVATFTFPKDIRPCWALSNLRPLCKEINQARPRIRM